MSSGQWKRHDGFNRWQIKDGTIVLVTKASRMVLQGVQKWTDRKNRNLHRHGALERDRYREAAEADGNPEKD